MIKIGAFEDTQKSGQSPCTMYLCMVCGQILPKMKKREFSSTCSSSSVDRLEEVVNTDNEEEEEEYEAWKIRELQRIKRDREELEQ